MRVSIVAAVLVLLVAAAHAARPMTESHSLTLSKGSSIDKKGKHPWVSPTGLFIQERASKQLPGPGQHFSFGALVTWDKIHEVLESDPDSKLVFLVRHGQAISNFLSDSLGPDEWFKWETKCTYDSNGTTLGIFDADLTDLGRAEADALNLMLKNGGWYNTLTAGKPARVIVSPLSRCLQTCTLALDGLPVTRYDVEENVRETLGEDTCDARRAVHDPTEGDPGKLQGVCKFEQGLISKYPAYSFPIVGSKGRNGFGLISDADAMWTEERETQGHQTKRALAFINDLFAFADERVVFVVTHSGFTRSVLLAVGREPYRPQNTELVPLIIQRVPRVAAQAADVE